MNGPRVIAGRYTLDRPLGAGAQGMVWLARDETLQREVAIKQVANNHRQMGEAAEVARQRAMREGRIAARLSHPHAVAVYDVAVDDDGLWLVMEYVRCRTLTEIVNGQGTVAPQRAALIGFQIASALAEAHRIGVVHRDVKPSNILIAETGEAKITDFGIARSLGDATLTATGLVTGTPAYFAPELARGAAEPNPSTDVWSLGATLYYAVEGRPPYGSDENPLVLLGRIARQEVPRPKSAGTLTSALMRLLDRVPARRPSMAEARAMLSALSRGTATIPLAALEEETAEHDRVPRRTAVQPAVGRAQAPHAPSLLPWKRPGARQAEGRPDAVSDETLRYDPVGADSPAAGASAPAPPGRGAVGGSVRGDGAARGRVDEPEAAPGASHGAADERNGADKLSDQTTDELPAPLPDDPDRAEERPDERSTQPRPEPSGERSEASAEERSGSGEARAGSAAAESESAKSRAASAAASKVRPGEAAERFAEEPDGGSGDRQASDDGAASGPRAPRSSRTGSANGRAAAKDGSHVSGTRAPGVAGPGAAALGAAGARAAGSGSDEAGADRAGARAAGSGSDEAAADRAGADAPDTPEAGEKAEKVPAAAVVGRKSEEAGRPHRDKGSGPADNGGGSSVVRGGRSSGGASDADDTDEDDTDEDDGRSRDAAAAAAGSPTLDADAELEPGGSAADVEPEPVAALAPGTAIEQGTASGQEDGTVPPSDSAVGAPPSAVPGPRRVRQRTVWLVACAILALLAGFGVYLLDQAGDDGREQLTANSPNTEGKDSEGRRAGKEEQQKQERQQEPTNEPQKEPSPDPEESPDSEDTDEKEPPLMRAEVMTQTVQEYYAMLPDNHAEAWNWLGPELQSQGFDKYAGWWSSVASVEVRNLQADPSGKTVTGTVVFRMKTGRVASERHRFGMIESEDGSRLLINTDSYLG